MAQRIVFLNRLRAGVSREQGDRFLRERDIPMARSVPSITSYEVTRLERHLFDDQGLPYDYIDVIEVTSVADYRRDIAALEQTGEWHAFVAEWEAHFDGERSLPVYGDVLA